MKFLHLKSPGKKHRADGSVYRQPVFVEKTRKYGQVLSEDNISIRQSILVTGAHASGKTRFLKTLFDNEREIWGAKIKYQAVYLSAVAPMVAWYESKPVVAWWDSQLGTEGHEIPFAKLKPLEKQEVLVKYIKTTGAVIFIDDAHKLTGRKLQIVIDCVCVSQIFVISAFSEQRMPPTLRLKVLNREPQTYRLSSEVSYDATDVLLWIIVILFMLAGMYEVGAIVGGLRLLSNGRRSTRDV